MLHISLGTRPPEAAFALGAFDLIAEILAVGAGCVEIVEDNGDMLLELQEHRDCYLSKLWVSLR